jgi:cell division septation protein DedD
MNCIFKRIGLIFPLFLILWGCNSTVYDIEEIEEKVDVVKPDTNSVTSNDEIKQDLKSDSKIPENKFTDKQVISREYAIQIGAFEKENNAFSFTEKAKNIIQQSVYYKKYEGLYKVRIGNFNNVDDAAGFLEKIKNLGYSDSFVVELTYIQNQDK